MGDHPGRCRPGWSCVSGVERSPPGGLGWGVRAYRFSLWDTQVWDVARLNHVSTVLSEDFNPGVAIEGVRFVDPFAGDFRLPDLGMGTISDCALTTNNRQLEQYLKIGNKYPLTISQNGIY